jgi:hypothetical protein
LQENPDNKHTMKTVRAITALAALAGSSAFAQLSTLPPPSSSDGVTIQPIGMNAGATHWEDPNDLGAYRVASDATSGPTPGNPDSVLGLTWAATPPGGAMAALNAVNAGGGTIRAIFTGETAGWYNDFGYTYDLTPVAPGSESYTVLSNVQAVPPSTVTFGQYIDVALLAGEASTFDFWLNATDSFTTANPTPPTTNGGVYTAFRPNNSSPYIGTGNVRWTQSPLMVNTWINATVGYQDVSTWLVAFEDWRLDRGSDNDYSDFIFAVQFFDSNGNPFGNNPVPEPSTYGLMGAVALLGLVAWRRRKAVAKK